MRKYSSARRALLSGFRSRARARVPYLCSPLERREAATLRDIPP